MTLAFVYPIFGLETTTTCTGCGLGTKLLKHNFVVATRVRDVSFTQQNICIYLQLLDSALFLIPAYLRFISNKRVFQKIKFRIFEVLLYIVKYKLRINLF